MNARSENDRLNREVETLRRQLSQQQAYRNENLILRRELRYRDSPSFPSCCRPVVATVLTNPSASYDQTVTIAAGSNDGIAPQDVVVTPEGLVGQVTKVFGSVSKVLLITDPDSAVRAIDAGNRAAIGILQHGSASNSLALTRVTKDKKVEAGDTIVTAGSLGEELPRCTRRTSSSGRSRASGRTTSTSSSSPGAAVRRPDRAAVGDRARRSRRPPRAKKHAAR